MRATFHEVEQVVAELLAALLQRTPGEVLGAVELVVLGAVEGGDEGGDGHVALRRVLVEVHAHDHDVLHGDFFFFFLLQLSNV